MVKGIIFDFNGTMFFDSDKQEDAWRTILQTKYNRVVTKEEFETQVHGRTNDVVFRYFSGEDLTDEQIERLSAEKEAVYRKLCKDDKENLKLVDGVIELLEYLKYKGVPFTIATASGKENVDFFIEEFELDKWFDLDKIIYNDGTFPGKPNPDIYQKAALAIHVKPKNCIVIEDAMSGIISAHQAGVEKIIAMASTSEPEYFDGRDEVYDIIRDFNGFEKYL